MMDEYLVERLKAIAHPLRFQILRALGAGEANVGEVEQATGIGQPGLSQQLSILRGAGLVETRRQSKMVFYSLAASQIGEVAAAIAALLPEASPVQAPPPSPHHSRSGAAVFATIDPAANIP